MQKNVLTPLAITFIVGAATITVAQSQPVQDTQARIDSAKNIIAQNENFKLHARQFHLDADADVQRAHKLKGQAESLEKALRAGTGKMDGTKLKDALGKYNIDLSDFRKHTMLYNAHLAQLQQQIGECHADEKQYQATLEQYKLHTQQFHIPDVRPPHICGQLDVSRVEARGIAGKLAGDQQRVLGEQAALAAAEGRLRDTVAQSFGTDVKVLREADRHVQEQKLAAEFARLKDEFESLTIENEALAGAAKPKVTAVISGKIKTK